MHVWLLVCGARDAMTMLSIETSIDVTQERHTFRKHVKLMQCFETLWWIIIIFFK